MIRTNRISVTERFKPLHKEGEAQLEGDSHAHNDQTSVLPGVFFIYDLSPFNVEVSTVSTPFSHFVVKVSECGGWRGRGGRENMVRMHACVLRMCVSYCSS